MQSKISNKFLRFFYKKIRNTIKCTNHYKKYLTIRLHKAM